MINLIHGKCEIYYLWYNMKQNREKEGLTYPKVWKQTFKFNNKKEGLKIDRFKQGRERIFTDEKYKVNTWEM